MLYMHMYLATEAARQSAALAVVVSPYTIFVYFKALVHERIILFLPLPVAILLHEYCAIYDPPQPPFECQTPYAIGIGNIL